MSQKQVLVEISMFPPFVTKFGDSYTGFEIELWGKVAKELDISFSYELTDFKELIPRLASQKADIALGGITMTEDRERTIDFTHSIFNSGLHILVSNKVRTSLSKAIRSLFSREVRNILLLLIVFVLISAHVIWFVEQAGTGSLAEPYWPGIFNAMWWALVTVSTIGYGDYTPVTVAGRLFGMFFILSGLAIFGLYIGQISSSLTLKRLRSTISTPEDLAGKKVATVEHTVAVSTLQKLGAQVVAVPTIDDAYHILEHEMVDAVVFDAPILLNYAYGLGKGKVTIVGGLFDQQNYGFALPRGSELRKSINQAILKLHDNGEYQVLYEKWFGNIY
jgi:polar amino acid transport system substrate-binding protein